MNARIWECFNVNLYVLRVEGVSEYCSRRSQGDTMSPYHDACMEVTQEAWWWERSCCTRHRRDGPGITALN